MMDNTFERACILVADVPQGFGTDPLVNNITRCIDLHCNNCSNNFKTCTACNKVEGLELIDSSCLNLSTIQSKIKYRTIFESSKSRGEVDYLDQDILFDESIYHDLHFQLINRENNSIFEDQSKFKFTPHRSGFYVDIGMEGMARDITLKISVKPNSSLAASNSTLQDFFPVVFDSFYYFNVPFKQLADLTKAALYPRTSFVLVSTVILSFFSYNQANLFEHLIFNDFEYLSFIGPQSNSITRVLLEPLKEFKFRVYPVEELIDDSNCRLPLIFYKNKVGCNFLANFGDDLVFLGLVLVICFLITILGYKLYQVDFLQGKIQPPIFQGGSLGYYSKKVLQTMIEKLNIAFFVGKIHADAFQIFLFSLVNLMSIRSEGVMVGGTAVSIALVLFMIFVGVYFVKTANEIEKHIRENRAGQDEDVSITIRNAGQFRSAKLALFGSLFSDFSVDGMRGPLSRHYLLAHYLKDMGVALVIALVGKLSAKMWIAGMLAAILELALLIIMIISRPSSKKSEDYFGIGATFLRLVYAVLAAVSFERFPKTALHAVDYVMAAILLVFLFGRLVSFIQSSVQILLKIYSKIKTIIVSYLVNRAALAQVDLLLGRELFFRMQNNWANPRNRILQRYLELMKPAPEEELNL